MRSPQFWGLGVNYKSFWVCLFSKRRGLKGVKKKVVKDERYLGAAFAIGVVMFLQIVGLIYLVFN